MKEDDLKCLHTVMTRIRQMWACPLSVDEICKLALTTTRVIETRRKVMGMDGASRDVEVAIYAKRYSPY